MRPALSLALLLAAAVPAASEEGPPPTNVPGTAAQRVEPEEAIRTAVAWLVEHQNPDGSWGTHRTGRVRGIWSDVPGGHLAFRVATSGLGVMALRGLAPEWRTEASERATAKGLGFLVKTGAVKRSQPAQIYNTWSLAYSLRAVAEALIDPREGDDTEGLRGVAKELVESLHVYQFVDGGWGYFDFKHRTFNPSGDSTSFSTATILVALHRAKEAGIEVPERMLRRALSCLRLTRSPDGSWIYSVDHRWYRRSLINRPKGALSRTPACAWALRLFTGRPDDAEIRKGLRRLIVHHRFAKAGVRRPIPHESWYAVSGYFYLYGYAYAAFAVELLPESERSEYRDPLIGAVLETRHPDGCFWDYPLYDYHKAYGTAYALIALDRLVRIPKAD